MTIYFISFRRMKYRFVKYWAWLLLLTGLFLGGAFPYVHAQTPAASGKIQVVYFYSETCKKCAAVNNGYLPQIRKKYGDKIDLRYYEMHSVENYQLLLNFEQKLGRTISKKPPIIICGNEVLEGDEAVRQRLDLVIGKVIQTRARINDRVPKRDQDSENQVKKGFKNINLLAVIGGGLLDGINPCAFTTIIFLISYLAFIGHNKRQLFLSGTVFTIGVFVAYILIGLGLLTLFQKLTWFPLASKIFSFIILLAVIILSVLNLWDYYLIKKGRLKETALQLSDFWKRNIHSAIRSGAKWNAYLAAAFGMGFLVALFEFPCTGQIYFPIIFMLKEVASMKAVALTFLLIYNIMFILPLIVIFALTYWGVASESITAYLMRNTGKVKLGTAILFIGIAIYMTLYGI